VIPVPSEIEQADPGGVSWTNRSALGAIQAAQRPWADELGAQVGAEALRRAVALLDRVLEALTARRAAGP
jgi:hypothetical protein